MEMNMRAIVAAGVACLLLIAPCAAETDAGKDAAAAPVAAPSPAPPPAAAANPQPLQLASTKEECLQTLELVLTRALEADLLDDQVEEAEKQLERFEVACIEGEFTVALTAARAIEKLVGTNK
jgi:hypothetical protein